MRADGPAVPAAAGDIVVVTVPLRLPAGPCGTAARQGRRRHEHVVKAFNNVYFTHLGSLHRPADDAERSALAISGGDPAAKKTVSEFLDSIGYDTYDVGPLSEGWRHQRGTAAYVRPTRRPDQIPIGPDRQVTATTLERALDAAVRYRDM